METVEILKVSGAETVYAQDKASIDMQIATAKAYPRNEARSIDRALAEVSRDAKIAGKCNYSYRRGGEIVSGPSVALARVIAQSWGNLRIGTRVTAIDETHITAQAVVFDLENNYSATIEVRRLIIDKGIRRSHDMITVTGIAAQSIAFRNAVFNIVPKGHVDRVYQAALQVITGDISDETSFIKRRVSLFEKLKSAYSVTDAEIVAAVGRQAVDHITREDIVDLIGIGTSIKEGVLTIEEAFKKQKPGAQKDKATERVLGMIKEANTIEELDRYAKHVSPEQMDLFISKKQELEKNGSK